MPFGSFQVSDETAVANAVRFVKEAGADAVKIEGAGPSLARVQALVGAGIPVMGHVGLTPQSATMLGGFKAQGRTAAKARQLLADARALEAAGCFAVVLEAVPAAVARRVSDTLCPDDRYRSPDLTATAGPCLARPPRAQRPSTRAVREALRRRRIGDPAGAGGLRGRRPLRRLPAAEHTYTIPEDELALFDAAAEEREHAQDADR